MTTGRISALFEGVSRRTALKLSGATALLSLAGAARAQEGEEAERFSFDTLSERMRARAQEPYSEPAPVESPLTDLDYDSYRLVQFRPDHARWQDTGAPFRLHAYHPGWLFDQPVQLNEIVDGNVVPMDFSTADFRYQNELADRIPDNAELPGVAGFRINAPLNDPDLYDEVVSFLGASYFRALGRGNTYGLSARGVAVNTALGQSEEFPRFDTFWLERPADGADQIVFYASLESPSVTGAYRFVLNPGENTRIDVTARLFFRESVQQVGIAPLTSMFLFGPNDPGDFRDFRRAVHDSEALVLNGGGTSYARPLRNPAQLGNSYLNTSGPTSFGLVQRARSFDEFLDAGAHYERRPSLIVEPVGNWGAGAVRLIEIPTELETNDNVVAFWVPEGSVSAGDEIELDYRLYWGSTPPGTFPDLAYVRRTLTGEGGVAGVQDDNDREKFVIDFEGGSLPELSADTDVEPRVAATNGKVAEAVLSRIEGTDLWRLVIEVAADRGAVVELRADLRQGDTALSETWLYQWVRA